MEMHLSIAKLVRQLSCFGVNASVLGTMLAIVSYRVLRITDVWLHALVSCGYETASDSCNHVILGGERVLMEKHRQSP